MPAPFRPLIAAALFATCGVAVAAPPETHLATFWRVTTLNGQPAVPGGDITFRDGEISGATACNHYGGSYAEGADGALTVTLGRMTRRACFDVAATRERDLIDAFAATRRYAITGDRLTLLDAAGKEVAAFERGSEATLEGTRQKITSFLKDEGLHSTVSGSGAVVTFKDGRIEGSTGCSSFAGRYTLADGKLAISDLAVTGAVKSPCPDELTDQDAGIIAALPLATGLDVTRNLIRLLEPTKGWAVLWVTPDTW